MHVNIAGRNSGPEGVAEDGSVTIDVMANDRGEYTGAMGLVPRLLGTPGHGSLSLSGGYHLMNPVTHADGLTWEDIIYNSQITHTQDAVFFGTDTFTYTAVGTNIAFDSFYITGGVVTVTVEGVNDVPRGVDVDSLTILSAQHGQPVVLDVLSGVYDVDGDAFDLIAITQDSLGSVNINADGTITNLSATDQQGGSDSFTYTIEDAAGSRVVQTVAVTINPQRAPVASDDTLTIRAGERGQVFTPDVTANDSEPDGKTTEIIGVSGATLSTATLVNGQITYVTEAGRAGGTDTITYTIRDVTGLTDTATLTITIDPQLDPTANTDNFTLNRVDGWGSRTLDVLGNDADAGSLALKVVAVDYTGSGSLTLGQDGVLTYDPVDNVTADVQESFTYTVENTLGHQPSGRANILLDYNRLPANDLLYFGTNYSGTEDAVFTHPSFNKYQDIDGDFLFFIRIESEFAAQGAVQSRWPTRQLA